MKHRLLVTIDVEVEVTLPQGIDPKFLCTKIRGLVMMDGVVERKTVVHGWETGLIEPMDGPSILGPEA